MADLTIKTVHAPAAKIRTPLLVLHIFERDREPVGFVSKVDALYDQAISRVIARGDFTGRKEDTLLLYAPSADIGIERVLLVGAGTREEYTVERLRRAVGVAVRAAERYAIEDIMISVGHVQHLSEHMGDYNAGLAAVEAAVLARWEFREMKTQRPDDAPRKILNSVTIVAHEESEQREFDRAAAHGVITANAENFARELQTRPGNVVTPTYLGEVAKDMAKGRKLEVTVLDKAALEKEKMHALLAVAQGSVEEPRLIVMEYRGAAKSRKPLVIVGKGVTFDTGGISIKPADRMEEMKYDMSGAAATIAAMRGIADLGLEVNVIGIVPAAENMPSGTAVKPGDVIGSHLGKTIEVVNTDAEGRLILADALSYAMKYEPAAIIDAATLTGAIVIALGHHAAGLMGNHGGLLNEISAAGLRVGERCWKLPLWDEYREQIDSPVADLKNTGGRPAGSITAGWFLKEFVGEVPWAHLDIAGTAYRDEPAPYLRKGATGWPTRLFIEWVRARSDA